MDVDCDTDNAKFQRDARRVVDDRFNFNRIEIQTGVDGKGIARMHACPFDVFHDPGYDTSYPFSSQ